ncbi:unnamed protein product [Periconia digitata]|uniref:Uncharacterized protein n=1 Tax=Periconia digitata TaxID=1303443 RepID=A0A9W4XPJ7_9PLEO|nr:unnamed protein product [Periconia digitata]
MCPSIARCKFGYRRVLQFRGSTVTPQLSRVKSTASRVSWGIKIRLGGRFPKLCPTVVEGGIRTSSLHCIGILPRVGGIQNGYLFAAVHSDPPM